MKLLAVSIFAALIVLQDPDARRKQLIEDEIKAAIEKLKGHEGVDALRTLSELRDYSGPYLRNLFKESMPKDAKEDTPKLVQTRLLVCSALAEIGRGDAETVDLMIEATRDFGGYYDNTVSANAVMTLGRIGLTSASKVIPVLVELLKSDRAKTDKYLKAEIIRALGNLRAVEAEDLLLSVLAETIKTKEATGDDRLSYAIPALVVSALEKISSKKAVDELIKKEYIEEDVFRDPFFDRPISFFAARALAKLTGENFGSFEDQDEVVNRTVAKCKEWAKKKREAIEAAARAKEVAEKTEKTKKAIEALVSSIGHYKEKNGKLPENLDVIKDLYKVAITDGWDRPFIYRVPGTGADYDLQSYGDDNKDGGVGLDSDVWSHDKWGPVRIERTKVILKTIKDAIELYKIDTGRYPAELVMLHTKPAGVDNWRGSYVTGPELQKFEDAFGTKLVYKLTPDGKFELLSLGRDRAEGGTEDVDKDIRAE